MTDYAPISQDIAHAVHILQTGGVVAIPTETVYGLAALARDGDAVEKIFAIKGRPRSHPLIVHVATFEMALLWGIFHKDAQKLGERFWPGPLTLLVPRTSLVPDWVTGGRESVAIRIPNHPLTLQLLHDLNDALVAPSANKFGKVSPTSALHVAQDLGKEVDLILDGGECGIGVESTIVECNDGVRVLRPGAISQHDVEALLDVEVASDSTGQVRAPGMLASHYAPHAQVVLCDTLEDAQKCAHEFHDKGLKTFVIFEPHLPEYAQKLYSLLRQADRETCDVIVAVRAPYVGIGAAINDRLMKASAQRD
jgi:L-threonylcarbamoyladenylate synthase